MIRKSKILLAILTFQFSFFAYHSFSQNYIWAKSIGSIGDDWGSSIKFDGMGNCYITTSSSSSDSADFDPGLGTVNLPAGGYLAKYDANGNYIWAKSIGASSLALDDTGNFYVAGGNGNGSIYFAKHDSNGNFLWADTIGYYYDFASSIAVDGSGNCYITGEFYSTADFDPGPGTANLTSFGPYANIFIAKYDANGNYLWAKTMGSTTNGERGNSIALDGAGNCYITGYFYGTTDFDPGPGIANITSIGQTDIFIAKYDANGNYLWAKGIGSNDYDEGYCIAVDSAGNCFITGYCKDTVDFDPSSGMAIDSSGGIFFAKYDANGNYLWAKTIGSTDYDFGRCITVDKFDNVFITGFFHYTIDFDPGPGMANHTANGFGDAFIAKYDNSGNYIWAMNIGGNNTDYCYSIAVDSVGYCYITGDFSDTADFDPGPGTANLTSIGGKDIFFAKYGQQPVIYIQPHDSSMCILSNQVISITASGAPVMSYQWQYNNSGAWNNVINGTPTGATYANQNTAALFVSGINSVGNFQYRCYVTNVFGADTSNSDTLTIIPPYHLNLDSVNGGINDTLTLTSYPATLDAGNGFQYYAWSNGAITQTTQATFSGWYSVTVSSSFGCSDVDSIFLEPACSAYFSLYPDTLVLHQYYAVNMATGTLPLTYLWGWGDGTFDNIAYPTHNYSTAGYYNICLTITDAIGCSNTYCDSSYLSKNGDAMVTVNVILPVGVNENTLNNSFSIFPNPANDIITITSGTMQKQTLVSIYNMQGQQVLQAQFNNRNTMDMDVSMLAKGIYLVKIQSENGVVNKKLVIQ